MTAPDTTQAQKDAGVKFWEAVAYTIASTALLTLFAGIALSRGFGVHVPFVDSWVLLLALLAVVRLVTLTVAGGWFNVKTKAAAPIAAAQYVGMAGAQSILATGSTEDIQGLLDGLKDGAK